MGKLSGTQKQGISDQLNVKIKNPPSIMIIAGEVSGDMHAADLVRAIRASRNDVECFGIGGERMRAAGVETIYDVREMAVMGFSEVVHRFGFFKRVFQETVDLAARRRPDMVVLVDYPGFNLRLAAKVHAMGIRVVYYICPQVWAWHRSRIPKMAGMLDRLITIFPFEAEHFEGTGLDVRFAGHPLVDEAVALLKTPAVRLAWGDEPGVALLPGSRVHEIEKLLPVMWKAATCLEKRRPGLPFIIAAPSAHEAGLIDDIIQTLPAGPTRHFVVTADTRQVLRQARAALVASGTATIEAALMRCPMVVCYKVAPLTYLLGRMLVRVENIGMVNIVAGKCICPELIQHRATPLGLADAIEPLIEDTPGRRSMVAELETVAEKMGSGGAAGKAAALVLEMLPDQS